MKREQAEALSKSTSRFGIASRFPFADGAEPLTLVLDAKVPRFEGAQGLEDAQEYYGTAARRFVAFLLIHAPGGFVDAVFGELAHHKATVFRVPHEKKQEREVKG